ncbi:FecR domain-containing protein [Candidatus Latescibacterota bacterium]
MKMKPNMLMRTTGIGISVLIFLMIMLTPAATQDTADAIIVRINGSLEFRENSSADWQQAKVKQLLYNGFQLRTETGNKAIVMYLGSSNRVLINENTELEIQVERGAPGQQPSRDRTKLMIGEVFSRVKTGTNYDVETPTSVASVRGTEFNAAYDIEGDASYLVYDQSVVEVMNQLGSVLLNQLQTITVSAGDTPSDADVATLSQGDADNAVDWTNDVAPSWKLNITPDGGTSHEMGKQFALLILAQDPDTNVNDTNATFELTAFDVSADVLEFSMDNGKTWTNAPRVSINNGQARVLARPIAEGSCDISVQAENCEPASVQVSVQKEKQRIQIILHFTMPDGTGGEDITLDLEEK